MRDGTSLSPNTLGHWLIPTAAAEKFPKALGAPKSATRKKQYKTMLDEHCRREEYGGLGWVLPPIVDMPVDSDDYKSFFFTREEGTNLYRAAFGMSSNILERRRRLHRSPEALERYQQQRDLVGQYNSDRFKLAQPWYNDITRATFTSWHDPVMVVLDLAIPDPKSNRLIQNNGTVWIAQRCDECGITAVGTPNMKHTCALTAALEKVETQTIWVPLPADVIRLFPGIQLEIDKLVKNGMLEAFSCDSELEDSDYIRAGYPTPNSRPSLPPIYIAGHKDKTALATAASPNGKLFRRLQAIDTLYRCHPPATEADRQFPDLMKAGHKELYQALGGNQQRLYFFHCNRAGCYLMDQPQMYARNPVAPAPWKHPMEAGKKSQTHSGTIGEPVADFRHVPYSVARRAIIATFFETDSMNKAVSGRLDAVLAYSSGA